MNASKRTAIVTGGAGFLGSHTVERLLGDGFRVRVIDLPSALYETNLAACAKDPNLEIERGDLLEFDASDKVFADADYIFHCSAIGEHVQSANTPELLIRANVLAVIRVLEAARHYGVKKVIYPSSAAVYGIAEAPTREDFPISPQNAYGMSKEMAEIAFRRWDTIYGVSSVCFRIFNGYGPRAAKSGVVGVFLEKKLKGEPIGILGDGGAERDFIYVSDIVDAFLLSTNTEGSGLYNLGSGVTRTVKELATLIGGPIDYGPAREGEPPVILADISSVQRDLGWRPTVSLEQGITNVLDSLGLEN